MQRHPRPIDIILHQQTRTLEVRFDDAAVFHLPWEYLRVFSPSKEVLGRRGKDRKLVTGKENVGITRLKPIGNYAVKIYFDDGHNSGLFDWRFLYELGVNQEAYWRDHLARLHPSDNRNP